MSIDLDYEIGISPVVGVILMVAISVALSAVVGLVVFDIGGNQDSNVNAGVEITETEQGVEVQWLTAGNVNAVQVHVDGAKLDTLSSPGESTTVTAENGDMVNVVGVNDGEETVVTQLVADSDTTSSGSGPEVVYDTPPSSDPHSTAPSDLNTVLNDMEGDGSASNPYIIMDDHDLQAMRADVGGHYKLGQDIDASKTDQWNGGTGFIPVSTDWQNEFTGVLDGDGYKIKGLTINRPSDYTVGLIAHTDGPTVKDIGVVNADVTGEQGVGILIGMAQYTTVKRSYTTGTVTAPDIAGGLIGHNQVSDSKIFQSYSTATVNGSGRDISGGLVGTNNGVIRNSYALGDVTGGTEVGGLAGYHQREITDSFSAGSVSGTGGNVNGFVGTNDTSSWVPDMEDGYWDTESSGQTTDASATGLTTSEMQGESAKSNMDFDFSESGKWETVDGEYPVLRALDKEEQLRHRD